MATAVDFVMHQKLLSDVILRQSGTLSKAILEGVMNSIEAGASRTDITVDSAKGKVTIEDDGRGMTEADIERNFRVFGQPHTAEENKTWAQFRMGRGQLFAFGRNRWHTGTSIIDIDIKKRLGYTLTKGPARKGCRIAVDLYDTDRSLGFLEGEVARAVRYVKTAVFFNGTRINRDIADVKWDFETDDAYFKLGKHEERYGYGVAVYNLGVYVCEHSKSTLGIQALVVSKKQLTVNFARNEVISSCPVWKRIRDFLKVHSEEALLSKANLSDEERSSLIARVVTGEIEYTAVGNAGILVDTSGHSRTPNQMRGRRWSLGEASDPRCDIANYLGKYLMLDAAWWKALFPAISPNEGMTKLGIQATFADPEQVLAKIDIEHTLVPEKKWTAKEKWLLNLLLCVSRRASTGPNPGSGFRKFVLGVSKSAYAWTDGTSYIAFSRTFLEDNFPITRSSCRVNGVKTTRYRWWSERWATLEKILLHEMAHQGQCKQEGHGPDFYRRFYEMSRELANPRRRSHLLPIVDLRGLPDWVPRPPYKRKAKAKAKKR